MAAVDQLAEQMKLLADKTRLTILALLKERELCVCDIVELVDISQPGVSQHLRKLKAAGIVNEARKGQWVYYSLNVDGLPHIQAILNEIPSMKQKLSNRNIHRCD